MHYKNECKIIEDYLQPSDLSMEEEILRLRKNFGKEIERICEKVSSVHTCNEPGDWDMSCSSPIFGST